jgi:hypothetical protein
MVRVGPESAREPVIKEIIRPKPRYGAQVLGVLPDKTLPEVEQQLAQRFLATDDYQVEGNVASLIFRYADADVWPEVASKVTENVGTWACEPQDTILAYALRADPGVAATLIARAIAARGEQKNACRHSIFTEIGKLWQDPLLEDLAIKGLADPDPSVAQDAARYLGNYASADAEQPLWDRYEAWSKEWSGREKEMRYVYGGENPNAEQGRLGENLALALTSGVGWLADEGKIRRIQQLGVGQSMSQVAETALSAWSARPLVIVCVAIGDPAEPYRFALAQYDLHSMDALKTKLRQFPRGTKFLSDSASCASSTGAENIFGEIFQVATENGMILLRMPAANHLADPGEGSGE